MATVTYKSCAYMSKHTTLEMIVSSRDQPTLSGGEGRSNYFESEGYALIGTATITVELHSPDQVVQNQIESLNAALQRERSESQMRQNAILDQISKLQALPFELV